MKNKILIIDIETTGFLPKGEIVEIGIVELDIKTGEKKIIYDQIIKPTHATKEEIDKSWIVEKGFLKTSDILKGDLIINQIINVQDIIVEYPLGSTAFNNVFDFNFLENEGISFSKKLPCPMKLMTPICKLPHPSGRKGYKWPSAQEAWEYFFGKNTGYIEKHRGADDAFHEADVVYALIKRGIFKV